jgi:heterodisulfide reductase subunit B
MKFSYFPGCSLRGTGRAYEESLLPVMKALGVELQEIEDWNCCGATAYMAVDEVKACVMASRDLALAEKMGNDEVLTPCSACYLVLNKAKHYIEDAPEVSEVVHKSLSTVGLKLTGKVQVRHPLDIIVNKIGLDEVKKRVKRPLTGLKVAPYYGCQIIRPYCTFDDQADPKTMDRLLEALGATVVKFPLKTKCCGGSLTGTLPQVGLRLAYIILKEAKKRQADVISTVCSLCLFNLDSYHDKISSRWEPVEVPTVFFTQLMGLAFGIPEDQLGLNRNILPFRLKELASAR